MWCKCLFSSIGPSFPLWIAAALFSLQRGVHTLTVRLPDRRLDEASRRSSGTSTIALDFTNVTEGWVSEVDAAVYGTYERVERVARVQVIIGNVHANTNT